MDELFTRGQDFRIATDSRGNKVILEPKMNNAQTLAESRVEDEVTELQLGVE